MIFLEEDVIMKILSWQNLEIGCYEYFEYQNSTMDTAVSTRPKRSVKQLSNNCSDHASGLAAAAFGVFAKVSIINEKQKFM